ncbi:MAG TPA: serine hydrolase domain-containing protein [Actinomycetota bacterium]
MGAGEPLLDKHIAPLVGDGGGGIVAGMLTSDLQMVHTYGPVPADGIFEIGSITKVLTAILLAEMVERDEVAFGDPVARFLPADVRVPARDGRPITLLELATHCSGLPRLPPNLEETVADESNPYAGYTVEHLYAGLAACDTAEEPGSYSNLGFGLLGHALSLAGGRPFADLVTGRVLAPLGMQETGTGFDAPRASRRMQGYEDGQPTSHWDNPTLAGAGCFEAPVADLLRLARAVVEPADTPLGRAIEATLPAHVPVNDKMSVCLAWHTYVQDGRTVHWHNGGTGGFGSMLAIDRKARAAVAVLSNSSHVPALDSATMFALLELVGS